MKRIGFRILGLLLCVLPPVIATLEYFPLWLGDKRSTVSAFTVILLFLAGIPILRLIRHRLRSPSAWMLWLVLWLFLTLFRPIAAAMETIALVSFPTSLAGAVCFRIAEHKKTE